LNISDKASFWKVKYQFTLDFGPQMNFSKNKKGWSVVGRFSNNCIANYVSKNSSNNALSKLLPNYSEKQANKRSENEKQKSYRQKKKTKVSLFYLK
jgi:hypothetical protein